MTANESQIVVYQPNETVRLDVRLENETVWLTQSQMATLFGSSTDNIGLHLKNVFAVGELSREATTEDFSVVRKVFWTGASLKDAGRLTFARMLVHPSGSAFAESSLRNASHFCGASQRRWATKSSPVFSPQSARRHRNAANTAKVN